MSQHENRTSVSFILKVSQDVLMLEVQRQLEA